MKKIVNQRLKKIIFIFTGVLMCLILPLCTCADDSITVDKAETEIVTTAPMPGYNMATYSETKAAQTYDAVIIASAAALIAFTGQRLSRKKK